MEVLYFRPLVEESPRSIRLPAPSGLAEKVDSVDTDDGFHPGGSRGTLDLRQQ